MAATVFSRVAVVTAAGPRAAPRRTPFSAAARAAPAQSSVFLGGRVAALPARRTPAAPAAGARPVTVSAADGHITHPVLQFVDRNDKKFNLASALVFLAVRVAAAAAFSYLFLNGGGKALFKAAGFPLAAKAAVAERSLAFCTAFVILTARQLLFSFYTSPFNMRMLASTIIAVAIPIVVASLGLVGLTSTAPYGLMDKLGFGLFVLGGAIETGSELQRKAFKDSPENRGKLYYGGLFSLAQHINYTGEVMWYTGLALMSNSLPLTAAVAVGFSGFFAGVGIPELQAHLRTKYLDQWTAAQARGSKLLFPGIY